MDPIRVNGYAEYAIEVNIDPYIHYRPAGRIAEFAKTFPHDIQIGHKGTRVNAKYAHELVGLQVCQYDQVSLYVSTSLPGYDDAAQAMAAKLENHDGRLNFEPRENKPVRLGFVGIGPYAVSGMLKHARKNPHVEIAAIAAASPAEQKRELLSEYPVPYYQMNGTIPSEFLDRVDMVYVSSPPAHHFSHIQQAGKRGKYVMAEKPVVISRGEFSSLIDEFGYHDNRIVPVVHYLGKPVTEYFTQHLRRKLAGRPIRKIDAVLFEEEGHDNTEGERLKRLISPLGGGGQHRDTGIHLNSVISVGAQVQLLGCLEAELYETSPGLPFETGAFVRSIGEGPQHEDVLVNTWVAKNVPKGSGMKKVTVYADDMTVEGDFMRSEVIVRKGDTVEVIPCRGQDPHDLVLKRTIAGIYAQLGGEEVMPYRLQDVRNAHDAIEMAYDRAGGLDHLDVIRDSNRVANFIASGTNAGRSALAR